MMSRWNWLKVAVHCYPGEVELEAKHFRHLPSQVFSWCRDLVWSHPHHHYQFWGILLSDTRQDQFWSYQRIPDNYKIVNVYKSVIQKIHTRINRRRQRSHDIWVINLALGGPRAKLAIPTRSDHCTMSAMQMESSLWPALFNALWSFAESLATGILYDQIGKYP